MSDWQFSVFENNFDYSKNLDLLLNSKDKCLLVNRNGRLAYAGPLRQLFEKFKGIFEYFGAINRINSEYVKSYVIGFLQFGESKGWTTSKKIQEIQHALPLFQTEENSKNLLFREIVSSDAEPSIQLDSELTTTIPLEEDLPFEETINPLFESVQRVTSCTHDVLQTNAVETTYLSPKIKASKKPYSKNNKVLMIAFGLFAMIALAWSGRHVYQNYYAVPIEPQSDLYTPLKELLREPLIHSLLNAPESLSLEELNQVGDKLKTFPAALSYEKYESLISKFGEACLIKGEYEEMEKMLKIFPQGNSPKKDKSRLSVVAKYVDMLFAKGDEKSRHQAFKILEENRSACGVGWCVKSEDLSNVLSKFIKDHYHIDRDQTLQAIEEMLHGIFQVELNQKREEFFRKSLEQELEWSERQKELDKYSYDFKNWTPEAQLFFSTLAQNCYESIHDSMNSERIKEVINTKATSAEVFDLYLKLPSFSLAEFQRTSFERLEKMFPRSEHQLVEENGSQKSKKPIDKKGSQSKQEHAERTPEEIAMYEKYCPILKISTEATFSEIKRAYNQLSLQYHPDKLVQKATESKEEFEHRKADALQKFYEVSEAFAQLAAQKGKRKPILTEGSKFNSKDVERFFEEMWGGFKGFKYKF